jgi:hypothetical protein
LFRLSSVACRVIFNVLLLLRWCCVIVAC